MDFTYLLQLVLSGILVGGIYSLLALGVVLIFKASGVLNFAQGDMTALGAFFAFFMANVASNYGLPYLPVMIIGLIVLAIAVSFSIQHFVLRPLIGQPIIASLMSTIALGMIISGFVTLFWPGAGRVLPPLIPTGSIAFGEISLSTGSLTSFVICMVVFGIFVLFFQKTKLGLAMRGTSEDQQLAQSVGIKVTGIFFACWFIAMLMAAASGVLIASLQMLDRETLAAYAAKAFPALLIGGLESIPGALLGGLIIGVVEMLSGGYLDKFVGGGAGEIMPFIVMLVILIFLPHGLFGYKRIERI
jgi:branched-chain amino acid transport system permease protein